MEPHFKATKSKFKKAFTRLSREGKDRYDLLEAAFFAYAHRNPLIDRIFWGRLYHAEQFILASGAQTVLDFGTGSGVLAYSLAHAGVAVVGADPDLRPLAEMQQIVDFPDTIRFIHTASLTDARCEGAFDAVVALDVLEHIPDLSDFVALAKRVLKPSGFVLVSGPTENFLYQLGRKLAGRQFTGEYHVSNIATIRERLAQEFEITPVRTIYQALPLFELFAARMPSPAHIPPMPTAARRPASESAR